MVHLFCDAVKTLQSIRATNLTISEATVLYSFCTVNSAKRGVTDTYYRTYWYLGHDLWSDALVLYHEVGREELSSVLYLLCVRYCSSNDAISI